MNSDKDTVTIPRELYEYLMGRINELEAREIKRNPHPPKDTFYWPYYDLQYRPSGSGNPTYPKIPLQTEITCTDLDPEIAAVISENISSLYVYDQT